MPYPAELFIKLTWPYLPQGLRLRIGSQLDRLRLVEAAGVPESEVEVIKDFHAKDEPAAVPLPPYSLLTTCYNEGADIESFLEGIIKQSAAPAEIVIVDGGSTDETVQKLEAWAEKVRGTLLAGTEVRIVKGARLNIAAGRNRAFAESTGELLLFTDAGCELDRHWAERMVLPFATDEKLEVSMGWYRPILRSGWSSAWAHFLVPRLDTINPKTFLPSGRSLAMKRMVFETTGGYPEHLTLAGEDTLFDLYLKSAAKRFAFVPSAIVFWRFPDGLYNSVRTAFRYSRGDGEGGGLFAGYYLKLLLQLGAVVIELLLAWLFIKFSTVLPHSLSGVSRLIGLGLAGFAGCRYLFLLLSYRPWIGASPVEAIKRLLVLNPLVISQGLGFLKGLLSKPEVERRRHVTATKGDLLLFLPLAPAVQGGLDEDNQYLHNLLKEGWFVTVVFNAMRPEHPLVYEHQHLECFIRKGFELEGWKRGRNSLELGRKLTVEDRVQDSWSAEIAAKSIG